LSRVVVIGLGNPDRGDDGVGPAVARSLAARLPPAIRVVVRRGDMLSLLTDWADADTVICIDAAAPAGSPVRRHRLDLSTDVLAPEPAPASSHGFGLAEAIALARTLGVAPSRIVVHAIEGVCFEPGAPMTPAVLAAAVAAADLIAAELA